jgi:hypothetical protein
MLRVVDPQADTGSDGGVPVVVIARVITEQWMLELTTRGTCTAWQGSRHGYG